MGEVSRVGNRYLVSSGSEIFNSTKHCNWRQGTRSLASTVPCISPLHSSFRELFGRVARLLHLWT
jgi:hypothetical protein